MNIVSVTVIGLVAVVFAFIVIESRKGEKASDAKNKALREAELNLWLNYTQADIVSYLEARQSEILQKLNETQAKLIVTDSSRKSDIASLTEKIESLRLEADKLAMYLADPVIYVETVRSEKIAFLQEQIKLFS